MHRPRKKQQEAEEKKKKRTGHIAQRQSDQPRAKRGKKSDKSKKAAENVREEMVATSPRPYKQIDHKQKAY